jgi:transcriptional regulator GlxA family with amidase domain
MADSNPTVVIPVYDKVDLLDVAGVHEMLTWADIEPDVVAERAGPIVTRAGLRFEARAFADAPGPYTAIWVPGGTDDAIDSIVADPDGPYMTYVKTQAARATWVCSVCTGALLLARAGLLDGYEATTHWGGIPTLLRDYPKIRVADGHPRFVVSGNRLTGGGISSGLDEALKLIELLKGQGAAEKAQKMTQYYPDPPVCSRIPNVIE